MTHFGRTGSKQRPRLRKFHAEILLTKFLNNETVLSQIELNRPPDYLKRIVKYSKGFLKFLNEEEGEMEITKEFFTQMRSWYKQFTDVEDLDHSDLNLEEQGILLRDDSISFDGRLTYSRFYKVVSDEGEGMNDPKHWAFNDKNIELHESINFSTRACAVFESRLFLLKFYVMRKIDEVAFVTSKFVHCPVCGSNYVVPSSKIDFVQSYKCEKMVGDKQCKTVLKKFTARKMIPTYIYEIGVDIINEDGSTDLKEFFLESFTPLVPGFYTGMCFGRTENKTNSFYFNCLTAKSEKGKHTFDYLENVQNEHEFFNITDSITNHIKKIGFVIDEDKARLPVYIETLKKITHIFNKEINLDHSLYFGAPGIGKTYALTMLHHLFYSNSGFISGPRFTLPGLTGGQKEIFYQDTAKKKTVPGLFSNQAFIFDEINNAQFLNDDKATNLFKSVALAASGTSSTVGGKEFPRSAMISGTANYDMEHLRHYENKVKKVFKTSLGEIKTETPKNPNPNAQQSAFIPQANFMASLEAKSELPDNFDFYKSMKNYGINTNISLKRAMLKIRDEAKNYLTDFPKPLMERFYYTVLVHPKYDKAYAAQKKIDVKGFMARRKIKFSQRELISQLFAPDFTDIIRERAQATLLKFNDTKIEQRWANDVEVFLELMGERYKQFFSMFNRISQVHVFTLYALSLVNGETVLSFETKRIYEKIISLLHTPIAMEDFHKPDFDKFFYIGETRGSLLKSIRKLPCRDIRKIVDFRRHNPLPNLVLLENDNKIRKLGDNIYEVQKKSKFEEIKK